MESFVRWLTEIGLQGYASVFTQHEVDFDVVGTLTEADLQSLGLPLGARKRLLQAVGKLNGQSRAEPTLPPATPPTAIPLTITQTLDASAGERRQLTVMFCDLVGSTALSEKLDPEELRKLLHEYRTACEAVISRYDGFVARYVGDGILTYFGWPKAHEEDAERALRAALEIVQAVKRASASEKLSVRVGIATGPVVVGERAGSGGEARLAVGSTPNLAARLQGLAAADQVLVAASTRRLVKNSFDLADLGEHELKGIAEPVHVWQVLSVSSALSRFERATQGLVTPLVAREQEIGLLLDRWQQAREGEGQVVLLSGEPGIGKSRVASTLRQRLADQGVSTLQFQCSPYHINSAFYPISNNFERALKFARDETVESKLDKLEALIVTYYGRPLADVRFFAAMLSIPCEARYSALPMTPQKHKDETLRSLVDLTDGAARKRPSVLLFEDAHWADPTTLEVLALLIDRVRAMPLLTVLTHRPEFQPRWGTHGHVMSLNLSKLTRGQSGAIVSKLTGGKGLPPELSEQILEKTDGVPLYVEELTKSILESGELKDAGDHYDYVGTARTVTIPATLRDSLMARLDRDQAAKEIAQIGAAIGREFSYELIAAVAPQSPGDLDAALSKLTESGLTFRRGTPPEAVYTFKHALVQDAAYDSLLKSRRQELHGQIAHVLEEQFPETKNTAPELLAHHLTAAGRGEAAIAYWQQAGKLAIRRLAIQEAISHLNQGMDIVNALPPSAARDAKELGLRTPLGTAWLANKGWAAPEVWASYHPALALAKPLGRRDALIPIYNGLWSNILVSGRIEDSLDWVKEMLATAEATGDSDLSLEAHRMACGTHFYQGNLADSRHHGDVVNKLYDAAQHRHIADIINVDPKTTVGVYSSPATWIQGYPDRARDIGNESTLHAHQRAHPFNLGYALTAGSMVWHFRGEHGQVLERAEEAERLGRAHRLLFVSEVMAQIFKAVAWLGEERLADGIPLLRRATERWNASGAQVLMPYLRAVLAEGLARSGDLDGGLSLIEESVAQIARPGWEERWSLAEVLRLRGWMKQQQGDLEAAEGEYMASLDVAREQQAKSWELRTSLSLARLWQSQGKNREGYDLVKPVYDWFKEGLDTKDLKEAARFLK